MLGSLCALALLQAQPQFVATRFEMGERLKELDVAWLGTRDRARRAAAVPHITTAVTSFFTQQYGPACRALDQARAALEGRTLRPEDAIDVRFTPPIVEPGAPARIQVSWAYAPGNELSVPVRAGGREAFSRPGTVTTLDVRLSAVFPDAAEQEVSLLFPVTVGQRVTSSYVNVVKGYAERQKVLSASEDATVRSLATWLQTVQELKAEQDVPVIDTLFAAEEIVEGERKATDLERVPLAIHEGAPLAALFPVEVPANPTVVIALHGAGGSENLFIEGYGRGQAAVEAIERGWIFLSPRASATAAAKSLDWLEKVRGIKPARVIVMGHSMGGGLALMTGKLPIKPSAVVLFAPAGGRIPDDLADVPVFLAVGKNELAMLLTTARRLGEQVKGRPVSIYREYDACEHLMIVAEATKDAYAWLDQRMRAPGLRSRER